MRWRWVWPPGAWARDDRGPGRPSRPPPGLRSPATSASRSAPGTSWHGCTPTPRSASPARPRRSTGPGISPLWAPWCPSAGSCWTASPDHLVPRRALPRSGPWRSRGTARPGAARRTRGGLELSQQLEILGSEPDPELLLDLPDRRLQRRLAGFELPADLHVRTGAALAHRQHLGAQRPFAQEGDRRDRQDVGAVTAGADA